MAYRQCKLFEIMVINKREDEWLSINKEKIILQLWKVEAQLHEENGTSQSWVSTWINTSQR
jgi:hypothetical protein